MRSRFSLCVVCKEKGGAGEAAKIPKEFFFGDSPAGEPCKCGEAAFAISLLCKAIDRNASRSCQGSPSTA